MRTFPLPASRLRPEIRCLFFICAALASLSGLARAQSLPKTADIAEDVAPDGSVNMGFQMTFDAAPWRAWKSMIGDEPARLRAMMRHQFAAFTLEDFKLDRDDMNRVAKISMRSPSGPELRDDGSFQVPVDGYFRLVNNAGNVWYFSGNNPSAGYTLNNVKVTLPANAQNAYVANPNNPDQALVFALTPPPSSSRWYYLAGGAALILGLASLLAGVLNRQRAQMLPAATPRALARSGTVISVPPMISEPAAPAVIVTPPQAQPPPIPQSGRVDLDKPRQDTGHIYNEPD